MKQLIIGIALFFIGMPTFSQDFTTNTTGSEYKFEKIAKLDANPVQAQGSTGTCWSFSALSFVETELMRMGKGKHHLSEMWIAYHAYVGKAETYIRMDGKSNFAQGGAFHDIMWVIKRYGIVPVSAYDGINYESETHNHSALFKTLSGVVKGLLSARSGLSASSLRAVKSILNTYLGDVPNNLEDFKFTEDGKEFNPITFRDNLELNPSDYISLTSLTNHPFYEKCIMAIPDNWALGASYNLPLEDLWKVARHALTTGHSFAWASDVSEKYFNFTSGLAIVPEDKSTIFETGKNNKNFSDAGSEKKASCFLKPTKEEVITQEKRQIAYDTKKTTDDHGMHAVGLYKDQEGTEYLWIKNSWGDSSNKCDGYFYASEAFFKYKTTNIYLHKDALPKDLKKRLGIK